MRTPHVLLICLILSLLAGCTAFGPPTPLLDEAEVRAKRGEPSRIWENDDGTRTFEYATQPYGVTAWMYTLDGAGKVVKQLDALSEESRRLVKPGMSRDEIRRLLGRERSVQHFALSGEEVWDWNVPREYPGLVASLFNVHFVDDKVVRTSMTHISPERNWNIGVGIGHGFGSHWGLGFGWGWPGYGGYCCW